MAESNIPRIDNILKVIKTYYGKLELGTSDIAELFNIGKNKALRLKRAVQEYMIANELPIINANYVDTEEAFKVWGIDINKLEKRYEKLKKYESNM